MKSVTPPTKYLTFGTWIYLVPQFKPKNVLILGYAGETVANLIRLIHGDVEIVGVDTESCVTLDRFYCQDAAAFVRDNAEEFDCVVVDVWDGNQACDFVFEKWFADRLKEFAKYVIVNVNSTPWMEYYGTHVRRITVGNNNIHYFSYGIPLEDVLPYPPTDNDLTL